MAPLPGRASRGIAALWLFCSRRKARTLLDRCTAFPVVPNVGATLPAEAGAVSLVRDDAPSAADQAYSACHSGSA